MYTSLPQTSAEFEQLSWAQIEPWFHELLAVQLTPANVEKWLKQWSQLSALIDETNVWLRILTWQDTANEAYRERRTRFLEELFGPFQRTDHQVKTHLLASGLSPEGFAIPLRKLRVDTELFREENVALLTQEQKLVEAYSSLSKAQ